jgi:creatinine amidohydrolase/Fe(II)-dependent formamide hydrolase-like protein
MIAPMGKPVICEELTWKDVDKLTKTMKMAIISTAACEQPSLHLPLAVDTVDCSEVAKRVSQRTAVPATIDKIVDLIATILVKFLIVIVFAQKKFGGGERTI